MHFVGKMLGVFMKASAELCNWLSCGTAEYTHTIEEYLLSYEDQDRVHPKEALNSDTCKLVYTYIAHTARIMLKMGVDIDRLP